MLNEKKFSVILPATIQKGGDGEWKIKGLASTPSRDAQGEIILQAGIDLTPIDQGRGLLNWDHQKGPENTVGVLDGYSRSEKGLVVEGRLFKNHAKAKAIHEIMSSLGKSDHGRMGMSVEGRILERAGKDGKIIKKCQINAVALTMSPVNQESYVDLMKSLSTEAELDFQSTENIGEIVFDNEPTFTATQVMQLLQKALTAGEGYTKAPSERSNGEALSQEDMDAEPKKVPIVDHCMPEMKKKKKMKKLSKDMYKSLMCQVLDNIQKLYPDYPRTKIWEAVKDRLNKKFEQI